MKKRELLIGIIYRFIPDIFFHKRRFKKKFGFKLNYKRLVTLNEKMQWLKLYDRTPLHTQCADKYEVRSYVKEIIGEEYLIPLVFSTQNYREVIKENIPDYPVIMKCNHNSGGYTIVKNKDEIDWPKERFKFKNQLKLNYYYQSLEWPYKNIKPRIIVEKLLLNNKGKIPEDYKFHCFNGKVMFLSVDFNRGTEKHTRNWYYPSWERAPFYWTSYLPKYRKDTLPNEMDVPKPNLLHEMIEVAEKLSLPFKYNRVDLYCCDDKIYFGEITFFHDRGFRPIEPDGWDKKLGDLLDLNA